MIWSRLRLRIYFKSDFEIPKVWKARVSYAFKDPVWPESEDDRKMEYYCRNYYGDRGFRKNPAAVSVVPRVRSILFHGWMDWSDACYSTEYWLIIRLKSNKSTAKSADIEHGIHIVDDEEYWPENDEQKRRREKAVVEVEGIDTLSFELLERVVDGLTEEEFLA